MSTMKLLVTGVAGFIGFHTARRLLKEGHEVVGIDNLNDYYSVQLKKDRLSLLKENDRFSFESFDLENAEAMQAFSKIHGNFSGVIHLAAQAGVRYSLKNPQAYIDSNITGFLNLLEMLRRSESSDKTHLVYASTSSVYGLNETLPFSPHASAEHPVSLYAATKKANEMMAHSYSHLFQIPTTGLRFFTVYGPWGRPDMALFLFTRKILQGEPIEVFNQGNHDRDFTYVDDIVDGVVRVALNPQKKSDQWNAKTPDPSLSSAPYRIYNIGNHRKEKLMRYIEVIESCLGKKAEIQFLPMQKGDVPATDADIDDLRNDYGYEPQTRIEKGIEAFIQWYRSYYEV